MKRDRLGGGPPPDTTKEIPNAKVEFDWEQGKIPESEVTFSASRGGGPGGQGVNTTDSRVELRWHITGSASLSEEQKQRLRAYTKERAGKRLLQDTDELQFVCATERSQTQNKRECLKRLNAFLQTALTPEVERKATKKSKGVKAKEQRESYADKQRRAGRGKVQQWD